MNKKKSKKKRIIILVIVLVIVALGVFGYLRMRANQEEMAKTTYEIVDVTKGTIEVKVKGAGSVEPLNDETVYAGFSGTVKEVVAENGDVVSAGDVVAVLESDALESERLSLQKQISETDSLILTMRSASGSDKVISPAEGIVKAVYGKDGDSVDAVVTRDGALALICPDELLETNVQYTTGVGIGDKVNVTIGTKSAQGTVTGFDAGYATVEFKDDGFTLGEQATVTDANGGEMGSGTVAIANPVYVSARGGSIEEVNTEVGDEVSRGDKLFSLEGEILSSSLYTQLEQRESLQDDLDEVLFDIENLTVRAQIDGVISGLSLKENQLVQEGTALFAVKSNDAVKIDVDIDELDIAGIEVGEEASVTFDALPEKTYTAKVLKINPIGVAQNNVTNYTVTLSLENAQDVMIGMSADVQIVSQSAQDALIIPVEAIQILGGEKFVVFEADVDKDLAYTPATHKVVTGITDGVNIQILEGLNEGDRVAVPQVKEKSLQEQMWSYRGGNGMGGGGGSESSDSESSDSKSTGSQLAADE